MSRGDYSPEALLREARERETAAKAKRTPEGRDERLRGFYSRLFTIRDAYARAAVRADWRERFSRDPIFQRTPEAVRLALGRGAAHFAQAADTPAELEIIRAAAHYERERQSGVHPIMARLVLGRPIVVQDLDGPLPEPGPRLSNAAVLKALRAAIREDERQAEARLARALLKRVSKAGRELLEPRSSPEDRSGLLGALAWEASVSREDARAILEKLERAGIIDWDAPDRLYLAIPSELEARASVAPPEPTRYRVKRSALPRLVEPTGRRRTKPFKDWSLAAWALSCYAPRLEGSLFLAGDSWTWERTELRPADLGALPTLSRPRERHPTERLSEAVSKVDRALDHILASPGPLAYQTRRRLR